MARWFTGVMVSLLTGGLFVSACGGSTGTSGDGDGISGDGDGDGDSRGNGNGVSTSDGTQLINVTPIPGGGANAAPLSAGCGPETAQECTAPGGGCDNAALLSGGGVKVKSTGAVCFYGEGIEEPSATVEHITEAVAGEEYVHLRVIFDPDFVDTTYGECSFETGWGSKEDESEPPPDGKKRPKPRGAKGHTFKDLVGSDHVELKLYNCEDDLSMHVKVDFLNEDETAACGYASAGVTGGDGEVFIGNADDVLAVGTSLDRNLNGCGYCDIKESPCPSGDGYQASDAAPEWDFRMVYELWVKADAFGDAGFCRPSIEYVHASPAKADDHTILVEPDDCPPPPNDCPPNYELFLSSEGEYLCAGPPDDGDCLAGYELDLTSEGELCIPLGEQ